MNFATNLRLVAFTCFKKVVAKDVLTSFAQCQGVRHLYAAGPLGLDRYEAKREQTEGMFASIEDKFRERIRQIVGEEQSLVFTEDLKNMIHLAKADINDFDLIRKMIVKFCHQSRGLRFGVYTFGPVVMRMYYWLNQPEEAFKAITSNEYGSFYDQSTTYQVAMDLLYNNGRYDDVMNVFTRLQEKLLGGQKYSSFCFVLAMATLYKMNTKDSLQQALHYIETARMNGFNISQRGIMFVAHLALKQNMSHVTLELMELVRVQNSFCRSIRAIAFVDQGRTEDAISTVRSIIECEIVNPRLETTKVPNIMLEAMEAIEKSVDSTAQKELKVEFSRLKKSLQENNQIVEMTLEQFLDIPIVLFPREMSHDRSFGNSYLKNYDRRNNRFSDNRESRNYRFSDHRREGLTDRE